MHNRTQNYFSDNQAKEMKQYQKETEDDKGKIARKYISVLEVTCEMS